MKLTTLTTPEARLAALRESLTDSVEAMRRAAAILVEMERNKDDLAEVPAHLLRMLRQINANTLLPEVAGRLQGTLRIQASRLPIALQEKIIDPDFRVEVLMPDGEVAMLAPQRLTLGQIRQVFGDGFIRTPMEQRSVTTPEGRERAALQRRIGRGRPPGQQVEVNKEGGYVMHYGRRISKATMLRWLTELS